jgi:uncharacterized membrane protein
MTDATDAYDTGSTPTSATDSGATPTAPRRFDPLALIFGLLFLGLAGLALDGRPLAGTASWIVPAALAGVAVWLVVSAVTDRDRRAA